MFLTKFTITKPATEEMDTTAPGEELPETVAETTDPELAEFVEEPVGDMDPELVVPEEDLPEDTDVVEDVEEEIQGVESLGNEIEHLANLAYAIETYGISPALMQFADRDGLLSSTFIQIPATESMLGAYRPDSPTSTTALEGLTLALESKVSEWAAKAGGAAKSMAVKAGGLIKRAIVGAANLAKWVGSKTWDAAKATGRTIKAHPYKTIAIVLAAIAAVAGVIALCWTFPTQASAVGAWFGKIKSACAAIKWPFGKVEVEMLKISGPSDAINGTFKWVAPEAADSGIISSQVVGKIGALGWTRNAAVSAARSLGSVLGRVGTAVAGTGSKISSAGSTAAAYVGKKAVSGAGALAGASFKTGYAVGSTAAKVLGGGATTQEVTGLSVGIYSWLRFVSFAVKLTWTLLRKVVMAGVNLVKSAISKVVSAATGSGGEAEPADA